MEDIKLRRLSILNAVVIALALLSVYTGVPCFAADAITLKCDINVDGKTDEIWVIVDPVSNTMSWDGKRIELKTTNKYYSGTERSGSAVRFTYIRRIDRETGEAVGTMFADSNRHSDRIDMFKGKCGKTVPPPTKF